jgi:diguanylate cyclase (GGDEF)-like protein
MLNKKNIIKYSIVALSFISLALVVLWLATVTKTNDFFLQMEDKTFDLRQDFLATSKYKKPSKDIVIIDIDDASYEYLLEKYGDWPIPRDIHARMINYLELQKPSAIAFDLMFVKSMKSKSAADVALASAMAKNKNVFTSMNFDNQSEDVREAITLPKQLSVPVKNYSRINYFDNLNFLNCRAVIPQILNNTKNIGMINVIRSKDGILRKVPPFTVYQGAYYPYLAQKVGMDYLNKTEGLEVNDYIIDKHFNLKLGKRNIPLDLDGGAILNWYGPSKRGDTYTYTHVPFYKIVKAMSGEDIEKYDFKNKIIYIGVTSTSLFDIKSVPVDRVYPGVEIHATYINNLIDNNFIKRVSFPVELVLTLIIALAVGLIVVRSTSSIVSLGGTFLIMFGYIIFAYFLMMFFNLWISIILPVTAIFFVFVMAYIVKYLLKSRDFERQYKLATTDGLTELYNHRFFQEQMIMQVENCKRYNSQFSVILIDIDFFKKFNDTFGHQAGDAVLKQVAQALKKNVRSTDVVCRYGGEEMTIILSNTEKDEAIITAQKICQAVAKRPFKLSADKECNVTISLGVATYPEDGTTPAQLIEHSDKGLYLAKENGRNQVGLVG